MDQITYRGEELTTRDIINMTSSSLVLSGDVWQAIEKNRQVLEHLISQPDAKYYGINTGFGSMYKISISDEHLTRLQVNLLRSHACGVGPAAPTIVVRLTLLLKIISLAKGHSGVRREIVQGLLDLFNHQITPVVPTVGSLGASGDLAPLAHLCLPLIGEGEVVYKREQMPAQKALMLAGLEPITLQAKEGLALINGTQYSLAWLLNVANQATRIAEVADMCAAMSMDVYDAHPSPLDPGIHSIRRQVGQITSASHISDWLAGSDMIKVPKEHLQDPYSFRCAPQVHGASRDAIDYIYSIVDREINAVTDNPLVLDDEQGQRIVSGGNFHAQPLALASDFLAIALAEYGSISERRSYLLLGGQRGLPQALAVQPGIESGMMICQYTAAAIVNRNKILSHPASTDSIVTSAGQEDHVSMASNAGIKLYEINNNTWKLLAIEWMIANQALEFCRPALTSPRLEDKHNRYRLMVPALSEDRVYSSDIDITENFLRQITF